MPKFGVKIDIVQQPQQTNDPMQRYTQYTVEFDIIWNKFVYGRQIYKATSIDVGYEKVEVSA